MVKFLQSKNTNFLQNRQSAPKPIHPGAKVGAQTQKTMGDFKKSLQNQEPAIVQRGIVCGATAPKFDAVARRAIVEKAAFASRCGVTDAEYQQEGVPFVFDRRMEDIVRFEGYCKWRCIKHNIEIRGHNERQRHCRHYHKDDLFIARRKNGQFKRKFCTKTMRAMQNKARETFSEGEYQTILEERVTYIGDVPLKHKKCPSVSCALADQDHITVEHFDMLGVDEIDAQINKLMGGNPLIDRGYDNDNDTSECEMLNAQLASLALVEDAIEKLSVSMRRKNSQSAQDESEGAYYEHSSQPEPTGKPQTTPVFGVQFYQTNGGEVFNADRLLDWQPGSVSEINFPVGHDDSASHRQFGSAYYADVSDGRVPSDQSMLD